MGRHFGMEKAKSRNRNQSKEMSVNTDGTVVKKVTHREDKFQNENIGRNKNRVERTEYSGRDHDDRYIPDSGRESSLKEDNNNMQSEIMKDRDIDSKKRISKDTDKGKEKGRERNGD